MEHDNMQEVEYDDTEDMKLLAIERLASEAKYPKAEAEKILRDYPKLLTGMLCALYREKLAWLESEECHQWLESQFGRRQDEQPKLTPEYRAALLSEIIAAGRQRGPVSIPSANCDSEEYDPNGETFLGLHYDRADCETFLELADEAKMPADTPMARIALWAELANQMVSKNARPLIGR
jgi:hypothetical protein